MRRWNGSVFRKRTRLAQQALYRDLLSALLIKGDCSHQGDSPRTEQGSCQTPARGAKRCGSPPESVAVDVPGTISAGGATFHSRARRPGPRSDQGRILIRAQRRSRIAAHSLIARSTAGRSAPHGEYGATARLSAASTRRSSPRALPRAGGILPVAPGPHGPRGPTLRRPPL